MLSVYYIQLYSEIAFIAYSRIKEVGLCIQIKEELRFIKGY